MDDIVTKETEYIFYYVIISRDWLHATIRPHVAAMKIFMIEEVDAVDAHCLKNFTWECQDFSLKMWPHGRRNFHYHSLRSDLLLCRTPMASSNRRAGADWGKSLLNNRAETLQLPRGNIGMITPCIQRCINELHATRICLSNTRTLIQ